MKSTEISRSGDYGVRPNSIPAAIAVALALTFAIGAASIAPDSWTAADAADTVTTQIEIGPFEYFPGKYKNQANEIEPLPPQF